MFITSDIQAADFPEAQYSTGFDKVLNRGSATDIGALSRACLAEILS
jgi:hypothetical protein